MSSFLPAEQIAQRLDQIRLTIPDTVRLIAVSKQVPVELMRAAYEAGVRDFGESRIQEATGKQAQLQDLPDITWHFIGHVQSNKAAKVLDHFDWIHSVDSLKLAQRLNQLAIDRSHPPHICLQVKILPDPNKFGWSMAELLADLPALDHCTALAIEGLMTIPPYDLETAKTLTIFTRMRELAEQIQQQPWSHIQMKQLSMGMSDDYQLAIQAGATMVRLGRTLFGERQ